MRGRARDVRQLLALPQPFERNELALLHLVDLLRGAGAEWMDIQVMTPHLKALGAELVSRAFWRRPTQPALRCGRLGLN